MLPPTLWAATATCKMVLVLPLNLPFLLKDGKRSQARPPGDDRSFSPATTAFVRLAAREESLFADVEASATMDEASTAPQLAPDDGLQVAHTMSTEVENSPASGSDYQSPVSPYAYTPTTNMTTSMYAATQGPPPPPSSCPESNVHEKPPDDQRQKPAPWGLNPWLFAAIAAVIGMLISGAVVVRRHGVYVGQKQREVKSEGNKKGGVPQVYNTPFMPAKASKNQSR